MKTKLTVSGLLVLISLLSVRATAVVNDGPTPPECDGPTPCQGDGPTPSPTPTPSPSPSFCDNQTLNSNLVLWVSSYTTNAASLDINTYINICQTDFNNNCNSISDCGSSLWQLVTDSCSKNNVKIDVWGSTSSSSPVSRWTNLPHPFQKIVSVTGWNFQSSGGTTLSGNVPAIPAFGTFPFNSLNSPPNLTGGINGTTRGTIIFTGSSFDGTPWPGAGFGGGSGSIGGDARLSSGQWSLDLLYHHGNSWPIYCVAGQDRE